MSVNLQADAMSRSLKRPYGASATTAWPKMTQESICFSASSRPFPRQVQKRHPSMDVTKRPGPSYLRVRYR